MIKFKTVESIKLNSIAFAIISLFISANSAQAEISGDVRVGYFSSERDTRSNTKSESKQSRLRLRVGYSDSFNDNWSAKVRFAGRYSDEDKNYEAHHKFFKEIPGSDGLRLGDGTIDTLFFRYQNQSELKVTVGRQQTKKELDGVAKKSLDRNTSPNTDVTWTDGIVLDVKTDSNWNHQAIVQINYKEGATEVRRGPLDFTSSGSRLGYFYAIENKKKAGAIVQRGIDFSYIPDALCVDGSACLNREDYLGVVARSAAKWPLSKSGKAFMLAGSAGYAPNTQSNETAKIGTSGDVAGTAFQMTFNLINFFHHHSIGLVYGRVEAGWLLSPDFRNNNELIELRYKLVLDKKQKIEARVRQREELEQRTGSIQKQVDQDFYVRYTYKF